MARTALPLDDVLSEEEEEEEERKEISESLIDYIHWFKLCSCSGKKKNINYNLYPTKVDFMFSKKIKFLVSSFQQNTFLVTEDGEIHFWWGEIKTNKVFNLEKSSSIDYVFSCFIDLNNIRIVKTATNSYNFLALTDDGKMYYYKYDNPNVDHRMKQVNVKEKVTCIACSYEFYMIATENGKVYSWGKNDRDEIDMPMKTYIKHPREVDELSGSIIVKIVCGYHHALALTDKGKVYMWGTDDEYGEILSHYGSEIFFPIMLDIPNERKVLDIAAIESINSIKTEDGLIYIFGSFNVRSVSLVNHTVCEYTNIFNLCNSMMAQSPISMGYVYTDEEHSILNDLEAAFNNDSTSDFTIEVDGQSIYVHKAVLTIRSSYFRNIFQSDWGKNSQKLTLVHHYSYIVYKTFLKYMYTGKISLSCIEDKLNLLKLADEYREKNLEKDCIWMIRKEVNISNLFLINEIAMKYNKKELEEYCFKFYLKNMDDVMDSENFIQLDLNTKIMFINKANKFFTYS